MLVVPDEERLSILDTSHRTILIIPTKHPTIGMAIMAQSANTRQSRQWSIMIVKALGGTLMTPK